MEAFQKKINLMKSKINNIRNDIECIREDEKTNTHNHPHAPLTTNNHFTKAKPPYKHNQHNTSKQLTYKKYLFIPRSKTAQTTISNEKPSLNITKQLPQSRTKKYNSNNNSICNSIINNNNNNNTTTNNSIVYNFDYKLQNHSIETSFPLRKYNSHNNSARKHLSNVHLSKHLFKTKNKKDLFRRQTPLPNTIDITNSSSLNPERVFSPIHNISTANNNNSTYTKVSPYTLSNNQTYHKRNKTSSQEHFKRKCVNEHYTNNTHYRNDNNNNNAEDILMELVDICNEYYGDVSPMFVVENYKRLLRENKTQNEFIMRLQKLYLNYNGMNSRSKRKRSGEGSDMVEIWKWINGLVRDCNGKSGREKEGWVCDKENEYQVYCERIMKEYGLKNINEFSCFINKLLKKSNKNDNFLEGIKKILMADNKIEEYHK